MVLNLECPLCCSETFSCHNSLKYHLLSLVDHLLCPACQKRFDNVFELAMHIGRQCIDEIEDSQTITNNTTHPMLENTEVQTESKFIACNNLMEGSDIVENNQMESSSKNTCETDAPCLPEEFYNEDEYYCSTCNTYFTSVPEHITTFHTNEEVVFATEIDTPKIDSSVNSNENEHEEKPVDLPTSIKSAKLLDTVQQQDCVDKSGRLYIRKIVKIEKFWDDSQEQNNTALLELSKQKDEALKVSICENSDNKLVEIYECSKCEVKFLAIKQYYKHNCYEGYKTCFMCGEQFAKLKFLRAHMKTHKNISVETLKDPTITYKCEICNTAFMTSKSVRLHRRMHEPVKNKAIESPVGYGLEGIIGTERKNEMFLCEICNTSYNKEYEDAHIEFHSEKPNFSCQTCNRKLYTQENLDMHMKAHTEGKKIICEICKKVFLTEDKLEAHKPSDCHKRLYPCQYCGRRFAKPHEKVKHERIHTGEKPHVCGICGKSFRVNYCLTLHMRTHTGTRPYHCDQCGKRFKAHSVFAHHLKTHSSDRKFKCPFCPKTFKTSVQLAGHKNSHTKPFNCTECNRPFASLYAVRTHMETHQRQNNLKFICWLCGASYARAFALRDHFKEQHVDEIDSNVDFENMLLEPEHCKIAKEVECKDIDLIDNLEDNVQYTNKMEVDC